MKKSEGEILIQWNTYVDTIGNTFSVRNVKVSISRRLLVYFRGIAMHTHAVEHYEGAFRALPCCLLMIGLINTCCT